MQYGCGTLIEFISQPPPRLRDMLQHDALAATGRVRDLHALPAIFQITLPLVHVLI